MIRFCNKITPISHRWFVYIHGNNFLLGALRSVTRNNLLPSFSITYTHDTSRCKVSNKKGAKILGIKLKPSYAKSNFYNDVDRCHFYCPTGQKLEKQRFVVTIKKGITIISCYALLWLSSFCLTKHLEVTWVYTYTC